MSDSIVFGLNGKKVELSGSDADPSIRVLSYLREKNLGKITGAREGCGEGGCGACTVMVSEQTSNGEVKHYSINSCLVPLVSMDGKNITTVEGISGGVDNLHPVQERIVAYNGLQCGYCTPGFVMNLYSQLKSCDGAWTMQKAEESLDGNICRCTGYRPILDAYKSFAEDTTVEDHVCKTGTCDSHDSSLDSPFPEFLDGYQLQELSIEGEKMNWKRPTSVDQVLGLMGENPDINLVAGNTSIGIYRNYPNNGLLVDISSLEELKGIEVTDTGLSVGAGVSISSFINALEQAQKNEDKEKVQTFAALTSLVKRVANVHVRNRGTVAGNIAMAKTRGFLSDLVTGLMGVRAVIETISVSGKAKVTIEEFLSDPSLDGQIISRVEVPFTERKVCFETYKAALRPLNSHAYVNAALGVELAEDGTVASALLAFGGVMEDDQPGSHAVYAKNTAEFLESKQINADVIKEALSILGTELLPRSSPVEYRTSLVSGFLLKFLSSLSCDDGLKSAAHRHVRPVTTSKQFFDFSDTHKPVSKAITKVEARSLVSGDIKYTADRVVLSNTLYGALVLSEQARAKLVDVDSSEALQCPGVVQFVSAKDIKGANSVAGMSKDQPLFADGEVTYNGQIIGVVLADTLHHAIAGAKAVQVKYDTEGKKPVLTIADALAEEDPFYKTEIYNEYKMGDADAALAKAEHKVEGKAVMGSQYHFYLEPQAAYAIPEEDNSFTIHHGHQWPDYTHAVVAGALGVPQNKVRVHMKYLGGGFGGKLSNNVLFCAAAAVSAQASGLPVMLAVNRGTDMAVCGGREETEAEYSVGCDSSGKITSLKASCVKDSGISVELSFWANFCIASQLNMVYDIPDYTGESKLVRTNKSSRTAMRGPGSIEACFVAETIMDHIAYDLGKSPEEVREASLYSQDQEDAPQPNGAPLDNYVLPDMWSDLKKKVDFDTRAAEVAKFNSENRWVKRGVSLIPLRFEVAIWTKSVLVNVYPDGSVVIQGNGAEIGQGLHTKVIQAAAYSLGKVFEGQEAPDLMSKIRCVGYDSFVTPNGSFTGGSTGSEGMAGATLIACDELVARMKPVYDDLVSKAEDGAPPTWEALCGACCVNFPTIVANLSAQAVWDSKDAKGKPYQIYAVGFFEVELDVLTGEIAILKAHLIEDCGKSLNPAVDVGQVEGAFIMGLGYMFRERFEFDEENGKQTTNGTWEYKPPLACDVPEDFTVELKDNPTFANGVLSSKATGEPPLLLATGALSAVRQAVHSARADAGLSGFAALPVPSTPDIIRSFCGPSSDLL